VISLDEKQEHVEEIAKTENKTSSGLGQKIAFAVMGICIVVLAAALFMQSKKIDTLISKYEEQSRISEACINLLITHNVIDASELQQYGIYVQSDIQNVPDDSSSESNDIENENDTEEQNQTQTTETTDVPETSGEE